MASRSRFGRPAAVFVPVAVAVALACGVPGCDSPPSARDLPEWQPADHDKEPSAGAGQEQQQANSSAGAAGSATPRANGPEMVVEASWQQQCAQCHGAIGHGDGPTGPMVHAADLTLAAWQGTVTDDQIADVITHGKGKMPPFDLPPKVVAGLVARIRASRGH